MRRRPPTLPQQDGFIGQAGRELELAAARLIFAYDAAANVPMPMAQSRAALWNAPELARWFAGWAASGVRAQVDIATWRLKTRREPGLSRPSAYAELFTTYRTPDIVTTWQADDVFAAQRLAGLNPMALSALDGAAGHAVLTERFVPALSSEVLEPYFGSGATFERALAAGRLFVTDYRELGEITADADAPGWQAGRKLVAPIALFARTDATPKLTPIAIGLGPQRTFFARPSTPSGDEGWSLAKTFVQSADYNYNQVVNHLAFTHLIEESFCLAMHRRLAAQHPLHRLLSKHFAALLAINQIGVLTLISKGGIIAQILEGGLGGSIDLIRNAYASWTFAALDYPEQIRARGLADAATLPYFPYRDDGMLLWNLLGDYLDEYLALYYASDEDVKQDYELAAFAAQLSGGLDGGSGAIAGFPQQIAERATLRDVVRRIVWMAGPQHAAVNFPQVDYASFIPNMCAATYAPPPRGRVTPAHLLATLAPRAETQTQFRTAYSLAGYHYDRLLDYDLCGADASQAIVEKYFDRLTVDVTATIDARNAERANQPGLLPYSYLLPANVPNSSSV